jgi:hypothetical protein
MAAPTPTFLFPSMESTKQPKSPKSPKATLENPLLKNPSFLFGINAAAPSLVPEPKSPLMVSHTNSITANNHRINRPVYATPGPPPKASMSLGMKLMAPMEQVREIPCLVDSFYERMFLYSTSLLLPILFISLTLLSLFTGHSSLQGLPHPPLP